MLIGDNNLISRVFGCEKYIEIILMYGLKATEKNDISSNKSSFHIES